MRSSEVFSVWPRLCRLYLCCRRSWSLELWFSVFMFKGVSEVCFHRLHLFFSPSSVVLCTSTGDFRVLSSTTCWSTLLHPAWRFLTLLPVLLPVLEFAAVGSAAAVGPGSRSHRSRRFLLRFAGDLLVCYPWALTPTVYERHSKHLDCPVSVFFLNSVPLGRPFCCLLIIIRKNQASEVCWNSVITGAGGHSCSSYPI